MQQILYAAFRKSNEGHWATHLPVPTKRFSASLHWEIRGIPCHALSSTANHFTYKQQEDVHLIYAQHEPLHAVILHSSCPLLLLGSGTLSWVVRSQQKGLAAILQFKGFTSLVLRRWKAHKDQQWPFPARKAGTEGCVVLRNNGVDKTRWAHVFQPLFSAHPSAISQRRGDGQCLEMDSQPQFSSSGTTLPK